MRRMITGSLALSVGLTSAVLVVPVLSNPLAAKPHPVEAHTTELRLGDLASPATGVQARRGLPQGVALATDAAAQLSARYARSAQTAAAAAKTVVLRRDSVSTFSAVGVTWKRDPAVSGVSVAVRAKGADGTWGAWSTSDAEPDPSGRSAASVRDGAGMIWTGPSKGVEVSVTSVTGGVPRDVRVELIDPGASAADANPQAGAPASAANAGIAMPTIYTRAQWGADEKKMTWPPSYAPAVKAITLHHTVNSNNYTRAQVPAMLRAIYQYHAVSNGWGDIGYNVVVDRFGRLWEGRTGGITRAVVGAHAGGFNYGTSGISMLGNFSTAAVPSAVRESVARYAAWKLSLYGVNPTATTKLTGGQNTKYKNIVTVTLPTIFPHRMTSLTACPGTGGMNALPWIRTRAKALMGSWASPTYIASQIVTYDRTTATWYLRNGTELRQGVKGDIPQPGDWTGDSRADFLVYRPSTGQWLLRGAAAVAYGIKGDIPVAGYYGTGRALQHAVFRPSDATWHVRGLSAVTYGTAGDTPVQADYNGDGRTDFATFSPRTAKWSLRNVGSFTFGQAGDIPVPADYNGDGRAEAAVYRPNTGQWLIRGGATLAWGKPGDIPVPGLYDNDLKADAAVYRPGTRRFYVYRISSFPVGTSASTPLVYR